MEYCLVENNKIIMGPMTLPTRWVDGAGAIHPLSTLTSVALIALGWYAVIPSTITLTPYETIGSHSYVIAGTVINEVIVLTPPVLADIILKKTNIITQYRDMYLMGTFLWNANSWIGDSTARLNITGLTSAIANGVPLPAGFTWNDSLGVPVTMTSTNMVALGTALMIWVNTTYKTSEYHIAQINTLLTIGAVISYDHTLGWPT